MAEDYFTKMKKSYFKYVASLFLFFASATIGSFADNVAKIGDVGYATLNDAVAAAEAGQTVTLISDVEVTSMIPVTKSITLDLNGKTVTNNVTANRLFRLSDVTFTIEGNNGKVIIPSTTADPVGFVDFRDANNNAGASTKLVVNNAYFEGGTSGGSLFAFRSNGQVLELNNVDVTLTESNTFSIINGYQLSVDIKVTGGSYICRSTHKTAGVFQAGSGSNIEFTGVNVDTTVGPIFEVIGSSTAKFTDCTMKNTATNSYFATCVSSSNGSNVTVEGGSYEADYALYVFNSGGTINVNGGTFNGKNAAIQVDRLDGMPAATVNVNGGEFNGKVVCNGFEAAVNIGGGEINGDIDVKGKNAQVTISAGSVNGDFSKTGDGSTITITGGTFTTNTDITPYYAEGVTPVKSTDSNGNTVYSTAGGTSAFELNDKINSVVIENEIANTDVNYSRAFKGNWEAWFVPFDVELTDEILANYDFAEIWDTELVDGNTTIEYIMLGAGDKVEANIPYIVRAKTVSSEPQTLSFKNVTLKTTADVSPIGCSTIKHNFNFYGVYEKTTLLDKKGWFLDGASGAFCYSTNPDGKLLPLRFYMTIQSKADNSYIYGDPSATAKHVKIRVIGDNSGTTGITELVTGDTATSCGSVYNMQGVCVGNSLEGLAAGVYIIRGGKKVIVR